MTIFRVRKASTRGFEVYASGYTNGNGIHVGYYQYEGAAQNCAKRLNTYVEELVNNREDSND